MREQDVRRCNRLGDVEVSPETGARLDSICPALGASADVDPGHRVRFGVTLRLGRSSGAVGLKTHPNVLRSGTPTSKRYDVISRSL